MTALDSPAVKDPAPALWSPWEERTVEGFGPLVKVEILGPLAFEVRELALRTGQGPEATLNLALQFGLVMVREKAQAETPS